MAGHSKWANIKFKKAATDKKRAKLFTKLIREITTAARLGGGDPDANPRLRAAIDKALSGNMTRDTIERATKRGAGDSDGEDMFEVLYEGYGPGGVAVMVECLTDNRNRTVAEVRHAFTKCGGNLGTDGSVAYLFNKQGVLTFSPEHSEEQLMDAAIEAGASDVQTNQDGSIDVLTEPEHFLEVKDALKASELKPENAEVTMIPSTEVALDLKLAEKMLRLEDMLEDLDDVQNVYSNADIAAEIYEELGNG